MNAGQAAWWAALTLLAAVPAGAADFRLGVVGGGTFSKIPVVATGLVTEDQVFSVSVSRRTGFSAGGVLEVGYELGTLRLEPRYVQKGTKVNVSAQNRATGASESHSSNIELSYIDLPLIFRTELFKSKATRPYVMSGIGPNVLVSAKSDGEDIKASFKDVELGIISCLGVMHAVGRSLLMADFRLAASLTRIDKPQDPTQPKAKSASLQVAVSLVFGANK